MSFQFGFSQNAIIECHNWGFLADLKQQPHPSVEKKMKLFKNGRKMSLSYISKIMAA